MIRSLRAPRPVWSIALSIAASMTLISAPGAVAGVPAPGNDDFQDAARIRTLPATRTANLANATEQGYDPNTFCSNDVDTTVWYHFTPSRRMVLRADTIGSDGDTDIGVFRGSSLRDLEEVACSFDINSGTQNVDARVAFRANPGTRYYFMVGTSDAPGDLRFHLRQVTPPANDQVKHPVSIRSLPFHTVASNVNATFQTHENRFECEDMMATVWYSITPATDMVLRVDTYGTSIDTLVSVHTDIVQSRPICADDSVVAGAGSFQTSVAFRAQGGEKYFIGVGGFDNETGLIDLDVRRVTPPANDRWWNATDASPLPFTHVSNTRNATREQQERQRLFGCEEGGFDAQGIYQTVWYQHTATSTDDLIASVTADGTLNNQAMVAVYEGESLPDLELVDGGACGDSVQFTPDAGETYSFQVFASSARSGPIEFDLRTAP